MGNWKLDSVNLDFLRATAVCCVYVNHFSWAAGFGNPGSLGRFGVILFFVHTSLVLMSSLQRLELSGLRKPWALVTAFGIRRFFRIYPLSVFCVLLAPIFLIPASPLVPYRWFGAGHFLSNVALTQPLTESPNVYNVLWSLPLEVEMYCLLPFLYMLLRRPGKYRSLGLWVCACASAVIMPRFSQRLIVFSFAPCFVAGVLAFDLSRTARPRLPAWLWPIAVFTVILGFGPLDDIPLHSKIHRAWVLAFCLGLTIPCFRQLRWAPIKRISHVIAKYSYGLYLSHNAIFWLAFDRLRGLAWPARILVVASGSIGLPVALYHLIEKPLIDVGSRSASQPLLRGGQEPFDNLPIAGATQVYLGTDGEAPLAESAN